MARKKLAEVECINKNSCIFKEKDQQLLLLDLKKDHDDFKKAIVDFTKNSVDISSNTKAMSETLTRFKEDSKEHLLIIAESNQIIAGKKQVPLSVFVIIVGMLCGFLIASEVRYTGVDIELSWDGIKVTRNIPVTQATNKIDINQK